MEVREPLQKSGSTPSATEVSTRSPPQALETSTSSSGYLEQNYSSSQVLTTPDLLCGYGNLQDCHTSNKSSRMVSSTPRHCVSVRILVCLSSEICRPRQAPSHSSILLLQILASNMHSPLLGPASAL